MLIPIPALTMGQDGIRGSVAVDSVEVGAPVQAVTAATLCHHVARFVGGSMRSCAALHRTVYDVVEEPVDTGEGPAGTDVSCRLLWRQGPRAGFLFVAVLATAELTLSHTSWSITAELRNDTGGVIDKGIRWQGIEDLARHPAIQRGGDFIPERYWQPALLTSGLAIDEDAGMDVTGPRMLNLDPAHDGQLIELFVTTDNTQIFTVAVAEWLPTHLESEVE